MAYFVSVVQKKTDGTYSNSMSRYKTMDEAKVKAYTELAYGFGSDLALCSVAISDDGLYPSFCDTYTKPEDTTTTDATTTDATTTA